MNEELKKIVDAIIKRGIDDAQDEFPKKVIGYISKIQSTGEVLVDFLVKTGVIGKNPITKEAIEFAQKKLRDCEFLGTEILKLL